MGWMPDSVLAFGLVIADFPVRFLRKRLNKYARAGVVEIVPKSRHWVANAMDEERTRYLD